MAVDGSGNVYVADSAGQTIRRISNGGVVTTMAGTRSRGGSRDGAAHQAQFNFPQAVAADVNGNVVVADTGNHTIRVITKAGMVSTLAGIGCAGSTDGTGNAARFYTPSGVAVDEAGNVYIADTENRTIRKITSTGEVSTLAGKAGDLDLADGTGNAARFTDPASVAIDGSGNLYVVDSKAGMVRKISRTAMVSTLAGSWAWGSEDGHGSKARFKLPSGVATDEAGNVYVADTFNHTIRKITAAGVVSTLAGKAGVNGSKDGIGSEARFKEPHGVAVDNGGNVIVADNDNHTIRRITGAGVVSTVAGIAGRMGSKDGPGTTAEFFHPPGVAVDGSGNIYVPGRNHCTIRKISSTGVVTTIGGKVGAPGNAEGVGSEARFDNPTAIAVTRGGIVYVVNSDGHSIFQGVLIPEAPSSPTP